MPETLRQLISRGPIDPPTALSILRQLLNAVAFAHWRGVVYGCITPEDIVLDSSGHTTAAHFDITPAVGGSTRTSPDTAVGAAAYTAPEQINGEPASEQTDVFVLGVVAYEMLAGKHPFGAADGLSAGSVTERMLHETPPDMPPAILAGLPRHVPPVLGIAMAKHPKDRFPNAASFLEALKGPPAVADGMAADDRPLPGPVSPRRSRRRRWWLTGSVVGGLVVAAVVLLWTPGLAEHSATSSSTTAISARTASVGQSLLAFVRGAIATREAPTTTIATTTTTTTAATTTTTAATATTATPTTANAIFTPMRYEQTDSRLVYSGAWNTANDGSASGSSFSVASSSGASVSVTFEGTYLAWIAKKAPTYGLAAVTLDGKNLGTIDLYSASIGWQQKVWGSGKLKSGLHTVTITWTGKKSAAATGDSISVDAFDVMGSLIEVR